MRSSRRRPSETEAEQKCRSSATRRSPESAGSALSPWGLMAGATGLEPATFGVTGRQAPQKHEQNQCPVTFGVARTGRNLVRSVTQRRVGARSEAGSRSYQHHDRRHAHPLAEHLLNRGKLCAGERRPASAVRPNSRLGLSEVDAGALSGLAGFSLGLRRTLADNRGTSSDREWVRSSSPPRSARRSRARTGGLPAIALPPVGRRRAPRGCKEGYGLHCTIGYTFHCTTGRTPSSQTMRPAGLRWLTVRVPRRGGPFVSLFSECSEIFKKTGLSDVVHIRRRVGAFKSPHPANESSEQFGRGL